MQPDPSQHLGLIPHVINQMDIPYELRDECFSEGLVTIVEASRSFDSSKNVPLASWLSKNIRWSLQHWLAKQRARPTISFESVVEPPVEAKSGRYELDAALMRLKAILTEKEAQVILALACGYKGYEIAAKLKVTSVAVSRMKKSAQKKMRGVEW